MKKKSFLIKLFLLCVVSTYLSGCILFSMSGKSSSKNSDSQTYVTTDLLCSHRWKLTSGTLTQQNWINGKQQVGKTLRVLKWSNQPWILFKKDCTASESGIFTSTSEKLTWDRNGNDIVIRGKDMHVDEVVSNEFKFTIEVITQDYCRMTCVLTPETHNGTYLTYTLLFDNRSSK